MSEISIKFYKLFDLMNRRGIKRGELQKIMSSATAAKLLHGDVVNTSVVNKICKQFDVQPGDIMEYVPDTETEEEAEK